MQIGMRSLLSVTIALLAATAAIAGGGAARDPKFPLKFAPEVIKEEVLEYGEIYRTRVQFSNQSKETVKLKTVTGSCGCIEVSADKDVWLAGEKGFLNFTYVSGAVGDVSYFVLLETEDGRRHILPFESRVIRSFVWDPSSVVFESHFDETAESQDVKLFYYGDKVRPVRLLQALPDRPDIDVNLVKKKWSDQEFPTDLANKLERPCFGAFSIKPLKDAEHYLGDNKRKVKLMLVGDDAAGRTILIPVEIRMKQIFRIYPKPVVRRLLVGSEGVIHAETINIESLDQLRKVDKVSSYAVEGQCLSAGGVVSKGDGKFALEVICKAKPGATGTRRGRLGLSLNVKGHVFHESVDFLYLLAPKQK